MIARANAVRPDGRRVVLIAVAMALLTAAALLVFAPSDSHAAIAPPALSHRMATRAYAVGVPLSWLSATIPGVREDDVLDLLGTRAGERATATVVADRLRVVAVDERTLVLEGTADDAAAIAAAHARGIALVPVLRSAR